MGRRLGVGAAACCACLLVASCGGGTASRRHAVDRYFQRVDAVETQLRPALLSAQSAYNRFGRGKAPDPEALARAARTIRRVRGRVARVPAPVEASRIQGDILDLLDRESALADEVRGLAVYLPAEQRSLRRLRAAEISLRDDLGVSRTFVAQRRVFARFAARLEPVADGLRRLAVPAALSGWHRAEISRVERLRREAIALRRALRAHDAAAMTRRLGALRIDLAGRAPVSAERAAILDYDRRLAALSALAGRIDRERAALVRRLGG